jgi:hypothetical protein
MLIIIILKIQSLFICLLTEQRKGQIQKQGRAKKQMKPYTQTKGKKGHMYHSDNYTSIVTITPLNEWRAVT